MAELLKKLLDEADVKFGCFNAFCTERATEEAKKNLYNFLVSNGVTVSRTPKERGGEK
jgi:hypothetical protein